MIKTKLPVIVLRNTILLPHGEIRIEISEEADKDIISLAVNNHNGFLLLISPSFFTDDKLDIDDLPMYGTIGKITSNFELPNKNVRLSILGINRANIFEYSKPNSNDEIIDAIIGPFEIKENDEVEEEAKLRLLKKAFSSYVIATPNISNNITVRTNEETSLDRLTDIITNILTLSFEEKREFIDENDSIKRADRLLEILVKEKEVSKIERNLENKLKVELDKAQKEYILREKINVIKDELGEKDEKEKEIKEIKEKIDNLKAPKNIKTRLLSELKKYENYPITSPEVSISKNYIDTVLSLPFGIYTKDKKDLKKISEELNKTHFGLDDVKERILEYIAVKELTNAEVSPIICLVGPPGVGKTSLAISIAKALNRKFVKMSVGGVSDESEILGHRKTYIGAYPGRIINGLIKAKSSNPLFLIDEIDKMTKDIKGDPASALLEVLDKEQNKMFKDNYIDEEYDLSKIMFVLTANDINGIPYALRDRLEIINVNSYTEYEKIDIVKKYMFNKLLTENGLKEDNISFTDNSLKYLIDYYTKEAGVRELQRVLSSLMRKVSKKIVLSNSDVNIKLTKKTINELLGKEKYSHLENNEIMDSGIVNALGYTPYGGEIIPLEVTYYKGKGNIILTGSLGDVMKESANIALGYIKSHIKELNLNLKLIDENDIHINALEAAVPKDGPSAGIALTSAILSSLKDHSISNEYAMTGEISLKGKVLKVGGLREKITGAYNKGVKKIFIPFDNKNDIDELPDEIKNNIKFYFVKDYKEVFDVLFKK